MMGAAAWLVLRRRGGLFGVGTEAVRKVEVDGSKVLIRLDQHVLQADEVVSLCQIRTGRRLGSVGRRMLPPGSLELAISDHGPLILIDAGSPPPMLTVAPADETHEQRTGCPERGRLANLDGALDGHEEHERHDVTKHHSLEDGSLEDNSLEDNSAREDSLRNRSSLRNQSVSLGGRSVEVEHEDAVHRTEWTGGPSDGDSAGQTSR